MIIAKNEKGINFKSLLEHSLEVLSYVDINLNHLDENNLLDLLNNAYSSQELIFSKQDLKLLFGYVALFHDIGKADHKYQKFILDVNNKNQNNNFHKEEEKRSLKKGFVRHNKYSYILSQFFKFKTDNYLKNIVLKQIADYVILYHHSKFLAENDCEDKKLGEFLNKKEDLEKMLVLCKEYISSFYDFNESEPLLRIENNDKSIDLSFLKDVEFDLNKLNWFYYEQELKNKLFPKFKQYEMESDVNHIKQNAVKNIARLIFNKSDRVYNKADFDFLFKKELIDFDLLNKKFELNSKTLKQNEVIEKIVNRFNENEKVLVLNGAPGCGKTRIFTEVFSKLNNQKMIVITPRNTISLGLFNDFLAGYYLFDENVTFEILNSENKEKAYFDKKENKFVTKELVDEKDFYKSNIIFISIDHLVNLYNKNNNQFFYLMEEFLVFDEFHEIYEQPFLCIQFLEILYVLNCYKNSKILLTSGTVNPAFTKKLLAFLKQENFIDLDSFNHKEFSISKIEAKELNDVIIDKLNNNQKVISIFNTAVSSQENTISLVKKMLSEKIKEDFTIFNFHSKFKKTDREKILNNIFTTFGKGSVNEKHTSNKKLIFSGPIIQASLNVSAQNLITEKTNAENFLQRIGRLNRFEEHQENVSLFYFENEFEKYEALDNLFFDLFIKDEKTLTINKLRQLYKDFHSYLENSKEGKRILDKEIQKLFKESYKIYNNLKLEPVAIYNRNTDDEQQVLKIKQYGLRGKGGCLLRPVSFEMLENGLLKKLEDKENKNEFISLQEEQCYSLLNGYLEFSNDEDFKQKYTEIFSLKNKTVKDRKKALYQSNKYRDEISKIKSISHERPLISIFETEESINNNELKFEKNIEQHFYLKTKINETELKIGLLKLSKWLES